VTGRGRAPDGADRWAASGLQALTGRPDGPGLGPPPGLVAGLDALARAVAGLTGRLGVGVAVDPLTLLAERAAAAGLRRGGDVSCGGAARLVRAGDGWLAVNLARPEDWELVPAWLGLPEVEQGRWGPVLAAVRDRRPSEVVGTGAGLGLPVAVVGERSGDRPGRPSSGISVRRRASGPPRRLADLVVADLSALWAGPLVGSLLARGGARVVKVESAARLDGARRGPAALYRSLNGGKASVVLDLASAGGCRQLAAVVDRADVVVTASRPRALAQLGLDPAAPRPDGRPRVWLSITGYGTGPADRDRVAFGDDAAAAGGLVVWDRRGPCFCADAVADPSTGLAATAAVLVELEQGGDAVVEASMADVAAGLVVAAGRGAPPPAATGWAPDPPRSPGADTLTVLAELGIR